MSPIEYLDPTGMEPSAGGILMPKEETRKQTWLMDDMKRLARAAKTLHNREVEVMLMCSRCATANRQSVLVSTTNEVGQRILTCGCTERVVR